MKSARLTVWFKGVLAPACLDIQYIGEIDLGIKMWKWINKFPVRPVRLQLDLEP